MPDKTRFEREIDEILEKSEGDAKPRQRKRRQFEPFSPTAPKKPPPKTPASIKFDPGYVVIIGVIILAVAAFGPVAQTVLALVGAIVVAAGFVMWFRMGGSRHVGGGTGWRRKTDRSSSSTTTSEPEVKYWRGRRIEDKPQRKAPIDRSDRGKIIDFGTPDPTNDKDDKNDGPSQGKN